jgi:hypothetical protein
MLDLVYFLSLDIKDINCNIVLYCINTHYRPPGLSLALLALSILLFGTHSSKLALVKAKNLNHYLP